jgi:hypothetical protein
MEKNGAKKTTDVLYYRTIRSKHWLVSNVDALHAAGNFPMILTRCAGVKARRKTRGYTNFR